VIRLMKPIYIVLFFGLALSVSTAETNKLYVTDDGFLIRQAANGQTSMDPKQVEDAKTSRESLPAEEFPEGNWGKVQDGFQLSLRFDKPKYKVGEPITATILLRNITNRTLMYQASFIAGKSSPIGLAVTDHQSNLVRPTSDIIRVISSHEKKLYPNTQHKYQERLNAMYNLTTNGTYSVYAQTKIACPSCVEVESANVTIEIGND